uniref:hypothetical protein n=1 Tax=Kocuria palustris TaxID=71999 RepID=UPI001C9318D9
SFQAALRASQIRCHLSVRQSPPTADQALWILDIYGFVVGSLLIAFGNLGDRFGRFKLLESPRVC